MNSALLTSVLLPVAISIIMWSLGLALTTADFTRVFTAPRGVAIGMLNLAMISPLLAFAAAELFGLPPELAVGLVLLGASPGGIMANMMTHLSRGDTALSVSISAISGLASIVTVPLFLALAISHFDATGIGDVSMLGVVARVFAITVIPVAIGMEMRRRRRDLVERIYPIAKKLAFWIFVLVVAGAIVTEFEEVRLSFTEVAGAALALNVTAMTISYTISKFARLDDRQATAISLELGIHNSALAIAVAASLGEVVAIPAAVYSTFMIFTGAVFAWSMSRRNADLEREMGRRE